MDVENALRKRVEEFAGQDAHITSQANQIDLALLQSRHDFPIVFRPGPTQTFDYHRFNAPFLRLSEAGGV